MVDITESSFIHLYQTHYPDVRRFVCRRMGPDQADDVVGETFLAAWRRRRDLPDDPRPWLFRTARNVMLNATRGQRRQEAVAVRIAARGLPGAVDTIGQVDTSLDVVAAWRQLSPADQEILALHVWDDLDSRAAALVLGCARATYAMRLTRAKRRLARLLRAGSSSRIPVPTSRLEHP